MPAPPDNRGHAIGTSPFERRQAIRAIVLVASDVLALSLAFLLAGLLAMTVSEAVLNRPYSPIADMLASRSVQVAVFGTLALGWLLLRNHYSRRIPWWIESREVILACLLALLGDGFLQFALKEEFSRLWLSFTWALGAATVLASRQLCRVVLRHLALQTIPVMLVARPPQAEAVHEALAENATLGYRIVATMVPDQLGRDDPTWVGTLHRHGADMVILAMTDDDMRHNAPFIRGLGLERVPFLLLRDMAGIPIATMEVQGLLGRDVLMLSNDSLLGTWLGRGLKIGFDHCGAAILALTLAPLMLAVAAALKLGGGPALFVHERIGQNGRPFPCFKFRTMRADAEEALAQVLDSDPQCRHQWEQNRKLKQDPRVTRLGAWLRRTSLDELPQLLNVLRGEMSLVGPRPIVAAELPLYGRDQPFLTLCRPGITGLWQVSGRNDIDMSRRVALDCWYVANWSLWLDIVLLVKTIPAVIRRRGAY